MTQAWIIRAGRNDEYEELEFAHDLIAVGWGRIGDLTRQSTLAGIRSLVKRGYPEVSPRTWDAHAAQLYAFRTAVEVGDLVVLLRANAPDVAVGVIAGDYVHRPDLPARHVRAMRWVAREVPRSDIGVEDLDPPALTAIYRMRKDAALERLQHLVSDRTAAVDAAPAPVEHTAKGLPTSRPRTRPAPPPEAQAVTSVAYDGLRRNLNYARNLTSAGKHLEELKVSLFEVTDVYRAAWVQSVAAMDHWVHQEIYERMARLAASPDDKHPEYFRTFDLPLGAVQDIQAGKTTLQAAVDKHVRAKLSHETYQHPDKIRLGFRQVSDVADFWNKVAVVLCEQAGTKNSHTGKTVRENLQTAVNRRNKIAHEYDEDPDNPPNKRAITAVGTMQTIDWIDQVAAAILVVLDQK